MLELGRDRVISYDLHLAAEYLFYFVLRYGLEENETLPLV